MLSRAIPIAAAVLAASAIGFAVLGDSPRFYADVPANGRSYSCNAGTGPEVFVRFRDDGRTALVQAGGHELVLEFQGSDFMFDVYGGGGWELTLDPQVNVAGPRGVRFDNCE